MKISIFRVSHQINDDEDYKIGEIFSDFIIGSRTQPGRFYGDNDENDNISAQITHSEMRAHYYVWKNMSDGLDYVGFEHYRRLMFLDYLPYDELIEREPRLLFIREWVERDLGSEIFNDGLGLDAILRLRAQMSATDTRRIGERLGAHDIIAVRSQQISTRSEATDDNLLEMAIASARYFQGRRMLIDFHHTTTCYRNCFIMRRELFEEYMNFWYDVCRFLERSLECWPRQLGYYSEKIFSYYLFQKKMESPLLRVGYVPMIGR